MRAAHFDQDRSTAHFQFELTYPWEPAATIRILFISGFLTFPNSTEQKRRGGFGVYYHISYLGRPLSYLWLNSLPPALIFEEMLKAYANGMRDFWILNADDIKPAEIGMEFFRQMAYDGEKWNFKTQHNFLRSWAKCEFGEKRSVETANLMDQYFRLGFQRKPEHLQWNLPNETARTSDLDETEAAGGPANYALLRKRTEAIYKQLTPAKKNAFYELVLYPIRSASLANERFFAAELAETCKKRADAVIWAKRSIAANAENEAETRYFNEKLVNGKWRLIISPEMNEGQWTSMRSTPPKVSLAEFQTTGSEKTAEAPAISLPKPSKSTKGFGERDGVISIEAEHFTTRMKSIGFGWEAIWGLGRTGDSVSVFPQIARTFSLPSPTLDYKIYVSETAEFELSLFLIPTQPLIYGNGLRIAFAVDDETPQIIIADKDIEASSPKWADNILNQSTIGKSKVKIEKGQHVFRIFAVDTGVVLDKIVLNTNHLSKTYFGPAETKFIR